MKDIKNDFLCFLLKRPAPSPQTLGYIMTRCKIDLNSRFDCSYYYTTSLPFILLYNPENYDKQLFMSLVLNYNMKINVAPMMIDNNSYYLLHLAVECGDIYLVKLILSRLSDTEKHIQILYVNNRNEGILYFAKKSKNDDMIKYIKNIYEYEHLINQMHNFIL